MKAFELRDKLKLIPEDVEITIETDNHDIFSIEGIVYDLMAQNLTLSPFGKQTESEETNEY